MTSLYLDSRLKEMDRVAARVFVDRNAKGAPPKLRPRVKGDMRPFLRAALKSAAAARTALLGRRAHDFERDRLHALLCLALAQVAFRQPYMEEADAARSAKGGGRPRKADLAATWAARVEATKKRTHSALTAREIYEDIAAESGVVWTTVRDQVSKHRKARK